MEPMVERTKLLYDLEAMHGVPIVPDETRRGISLLEGPPFLNRVLKYLVKTKI